MLTVLSKPIQGVESALSVAGSLFMISTTMSMLLIIVVRILTTTAAPAPESGSAGAYLRASLLSELNGRDYHLLRDGSLVRQQLSN